MDIDAALYPRKPIERLGIAPLTSMFYYGENDRRAVNDWRPEIYDSDGVSMDRIRRVDLAAADQSCTNALQFLCRRKPARLRPAAARPGWDHYQDDGVYYDRRPSRGSNPNPAAGARARVQLVEIPRRTKPTTTSCCSGILRTSPRAARNCCSATGCIGARACPSLHRSQVIATRTGIGGIVGQKRQYYSAFRRRFCGRRTRCAGQDANVEAVIGTSRGSTTGTCDRALCRGVQGLPGLVRCQAAR